MIVAVQRGRLRDRKFAPPGHLPPKTTIADISPTLWLQFIYSYRFQERPQDFGQGVNAPLPHEAKKILKI